MGLTWAEIAALVTALVTAAGAVVAIVLRLVTWTLDRWAVDVKNRQDGLEQEHQAHEDICGERYASIEEKHAQIVKVSDERHKENLERLNRMEHKIDQLLVRSHR